MYIYICLCIFFYFVLIVFLFVVRATISLRSANQRRRRLCRRQRHMEWMVQTSDCTTQEKKEHSGRSAECAHFFVEEINVHVGGQGCWADTVAAAACEAAAA